MTAAAAELRTERLLLRRWLPEDLEPFAAYSADPEAMRYFPSTHSREQSDALAGEFARALEERGWGFWAVEVRDGPSFIGFVGLTEPSFEAHFTPAVEVGWRLGREHWGHGYATEAARAAIDFGFWKLDLEEIVAITVPDNVRSRRVMERLGMTYDPAGDFDHPRLPDGPLRRHVLYRLPRPPRGQSARSEILSERSIASSSGSWCRRAAREPAITRYSPNGRPAIVKHCCQPDWPGCTWARALVENRVGSRGKSIRRG